MFLLLDGSIDNLRFEDECRSLLGAGSYVLYTLDKLLFKLLNQIQLIMADDSCTQLLALCEYEWSRHAEYDESLYVQNVRRP